MERRLNTSITIFIFITYQKFVFTKTILLQRDERFLKTFITFEGNSSIYDFQNKQQDYIVLKAQKSA